MISLSLCSSSSTESGLELLQLGMCCFNSELLCDVSPMKLWGCFIRGQNLLSLQCFKVGLFLQDTDYFGVTVC